MKLKDKFKIPNIRIKINKQYRCGTFKKLKPSSVRYLARDTVEKLN